MNSYKEIETYLHLTGGDISYIGVTYLGHPIPIITKGRGCSDKRILLVGGVHAREYITSYLLFELIKEYDGDCIIDCVPILNIDGVLLCRRGLNIFKNKDLCKELLGLNDNNPDFSLWKANIRGVDINVNFDTDWGQGEQNILYPAAANYIGAHPHSEKETLAIVELLKKKDYNMIAAYHSKGEEVYYGYKD
ncbi:MAG: M14 family zinc carboxypeptidase, partial [Bacillota bacterium]